MRGSRNALRYGVLSIKNELRGINLYLVLLVMFCFILYSFMGVSDYLAANGDRMNLFELYVHFQSTRVAQTVYLLGIILVSCGTLFYSHGAAYYLIRGNRRQWVWGQGIYLLAMVAGYNLFLLITLWISSGGHLTFANEWSTASVLAEQFGAYTIGCRIIYVSHPVLQMSPVAAGMLTFLLSVLTGMATGMVMICFSIRNRGVFGVALIAILWFADILIRELAVIKVFSRTEFLSPFGLSRLARLLELGGGLVVLYGAAFFCILLAIEFYTLLGASEKIDFMKLE